MSEKEAFQCEFIYSVQVVDREQSAKSKSIILSQEFNALSKRAAVVTYRGIVRAKKYDDTKFAVNMLKRYVVALEDVQLENGSFLLYGDTLGYMGQDDKNYKVAIDGKGTFWVDKKYFKFFNIRTTSKDHNWMVTDFGKEKDLDYDWVECRVCGIKARRKIEDHSVKLQEKALRNCEPKRIITL